MKNPMNRRILRNIYKNIKAYIAIIIISLIAVLFYNCASIKSLPTANAKSRARFNKRFAILGVPRED